MTKAKIAALVTVAAISLAGCATIEADAYGLTTPLSIHLGTGSGVTEVPLPVTGGYSFTASDFEIRDYLMAQYLDGVDHTSVVAQLAQECYNLATSEGVSDGDRWLLACESPDYVWDFATGSWTSVN